MNLLQIRRNFSIPNRIFPLFHQYTQNIPSNFHYNVFVNSFAKPNTFSIRSFVFVRPRRFHSRFSHFHRFPVRIPPCGGRRALPVLSCAAPLRILKQKHPLSRRLLRFDRGYFCLSRTTGSRKSSGSDPHGKSFSFPPLRHCSICLPTMLAVVSATLSSVSPILAAGSLDRRTTAPMDSPSAIIGQITCAV